MAEQETWFAFSPLFLMREICQDARFVPETKLGLNEQEPAHCYYRRIAPGWGFGGSALFSPSESQQYHLP